MSAEKRYILAHLDEALAGGEPAGWYLCTQALINQGWKTEEGEWVRAWEDIDGMLLAKGAYDPGTDASEAAEARARRQAAEITGLDFGGGAEDDGGGVIRITPR
jgi:hypothetical protein